MSYRFFSELDPVAKKKKYTGKEMKFSQINKIFGNNKMNMFSKILIFAYKIKWAKACESTL